MPAVFRAILSQIHTFILIAVAGVIERTDTVSKIYRFYFSQTCHACPGAKAAIKAAGLEVKALDVESDEGRKEQVEDGINSVPCLIEDTDGVITGQWTGTQINEATMAKLKGR